VQYPSKIAIYDELEENMTAMLGLEKKLFSVKKTFGGDFADLIFFSGKVFVRSQN